MKNFFLFLFILISGMLFAQTDYNLIVQGSQDESFLNPVYSPDGNKIAYTQENYKGIWIYNFASGSNYQLTNEDAAGYGLKWSSDSKSILTRVAKYEDLKRFNAVKVFDVETKSSQQLTDYKTMMPYLPLWFDGDNKIFLPSKITDEVFVTGKANKNLGLNLIAFEKNNQIVVKDNSNNFERILNLFDDAQYINVSSSPDGNKIVFEVIGGNMFVVNSDGTNLIDLGRGNRPRWSFDSKKISYTITSDNGHVITDSDIYLVNSDGSDKTNISNSENLIEMNPCFSPDGKTIIFDVINDGSIYSMIIE